MLLASQGYPSLPAVFPVESCFQLEFPFEKGRVRQVQLNHLMRVMLLTHLFYTPSSDPITLNTRQHLHGALVYDSTSDSYELTQTVVETGAKSSQTVKCQNGKKYTIPYVVYEKTFPCKDYPPDGIVTFTEIVVECDGSDCASKVWGFASTPQAPLLYTCMRPCTLMSRYSTIYYPSPR